MSYDSNREPPYLSVNKVAETPKRLFLKKIQASKVKYIVQSGLAAILPTGLITSKISIRLRPHSKSPYRDTKNPRKTSFYWKYDLKRLAVNGRFYVFYFFLEFRYVEHVVCSHRWLCENVLITILFFQLLKV